MSGFDGCTIVCMYCWKSGSSGEKSRQDALVNADVLDDKHCGSARNGKRCNDLPNGIKPTRGSCDQQDWFYEHPPQRLSAVTFLPHSTKR